MTTTTVEEIEDWVKEIFAQPACWLELRSRMQDGAVRTWELPANGEGRTDARTIADQILKAATRHGKGLNAPEVGYLVVGLRAEGDTKVLNSIGIEVPGKTGQRGPGDPVLEDPRGYGPMAQSMRQNENLHRMMLGSAEQREQGLLRQLDAKDAEITRLRNELSDAAAKHMKIVQLAEDLAHDDLDRELQRRKMALQEKKHDYLESKLEALVPIALNRLTGGGPGKGMPMMGEKMLMQFFGSLKEEQVNGAMTAMGLNEDQAMMLMELYNSYFIKFAREKEAAEKAAGKHAEPKGDETNGTVGPAAAAEGSGP